MIDNEKLEERRLSEQSRMSENISPQHSTTTAHMSPLAELIMKQPICTALRSAKSSASPLPPPPPPSPPLEATSPTAILPHMHLVDSSSADTAATAAAAAGLTPHKAALARRAPVDCDLVSPAPFMPASLLGGGSALDHRASVASRARVNTPGSGLSKASRRRRGGAHDREMPCPSRLDDHHSHDLHFEDDETLPFSVPLSHDVMQSLVPSSDKESATVAGDSLPCGGLVAGHAKSGFATETVPTGRASTGSSSSSRVSSGSVGSSTSVLSNSSTTGASLKRLGLSGKFGGPARRVVASSEPTEETQVDTKAQAATKAQAVAKTQAAAKPQPVAKVQVTAAKETEPERTDGTDGDLSGRAGRNKATTRADADLARPEDPKPQPLKTRPRTGKKAGALSEPLATQGGILAAPAADLASTTDGLISGEVASTVVGGRDPGLENHTAWWLVLRHLSTDQIITTLPCVCRTLQALATDASLLASMLACLPGGPSVPMIEWPRISQAYPHGTFLAEGGFKRVFKVRNAVHQRDEAMSVLDLAHLRSQGLEDTLGTELWVSYLLGQIAASGRCPHFIRVHQVFRSSQAPLEEWGGDTDLGGDEEGDADTGGGTSDDELAIRLEGLELSTAALEGDAEAPAPAATTGGRAAARKPKKPTRKPPTNGPCFQYVLMEFCEGGDMEEACKALPKLSFPTDWLPGLAYQMLYALYTAQREVELRHYDIKLLNFFLCRPRAAEASSSQTGIADTDGAACGEATLHYGVRGLQHRFHLPASMATMCRLADFGTSDISPATLGQPVGTRHFTTLENTPPDFLLLGCGARQDFQADAFALGLCWLHLLTGRAPYEEILEPLRCPTELCTALSAVWAAEAPKRGTDDYAPLRELLAADEDAQDSVLFHTLYRFLCLFGRPDAEGGASNAVKGDAICQSKAWRAVRTWLDTSSGRSRFAKDRSAWCAFTGRSKPLAEAQRRMAALPGSEAMLRGLTTFDPSRRWSVERAMASELFEPYRWTEATDAGQPPTLCCMDYLDAAPPPSAD